MLQDGSIVLYQNEQVLDVDSVHSHSITRYRGPGTGKHVDQVPKFGGGCSFCRLLLVGGGSKFGRST
jgi:hypothetical protein